jgi:hypothetical protein
LSNAARAGLAAGAAHAVVARNERNVSAGDVDRVCRAAGNIEVVGIDQRGVVVGVDHARIELGI